jgi:hypothetical protein
VCGPRPVLALLIARAIEHRFLDGERDVLHLAGLRNDRDLSYWLRQRTREDFKDARTRLLASAVAATACPQRRDSVEDAVGAFLGRHDDRDFADGEVGVVGHLIELSWVLESDDDELDVVHDFVADELLQQALLPNRTRLEATTAAQMFSAFLVSVHTFRRAANHIRRWSTDLDAGKREEVRRVCGNWLRREGAAGLAESLSAEGDPAESGRTLLTLLSGPPWQSGVVQAWDELIAPWLARAGDEAPHLTHSFLAGAVRNTSDAVPERMSATAIAWVEENPDMRRETRTVLEALLRAPGVHSTHRSDAVRLAVRWLGAHGTVWGSRPLALAETLLTRDDLPEHLVEEVLEESLAVARSLLPVPAAAHVLDALLRRGDLGPARREQAVTLAFTWLKRHPDADRASFVLVSLLQQDLEGDGLRSVFDRSLNWLADRRTSPLAPFVLRRLLKHPAMSGKRLEDATRIAEEWLTKRGGQYEATFVLNPLLLRPDHVQDTGHLVGLALDWLKAHHPYEDAHFMLRAVLEQPRLPEEGREQIARFALSWLRTGDNSAKEYAKSVLGPLLGRRGLPDEEDHCAAAVRWLDADANLGSEEASFVLDPLLRHPALGPHSEDARRLALDWLERHPRSGNVSYVLGPLIARLGFTRDGDTAPDPVGIGFDWLAEHGTSDVARFVLAPVLRPDRAGLRAAPQALTWLGSGDNGTLREAMFVLQPLLRCPGLDGDLAAGAVDRALDWLEVHHCADHADRVLAPLFDFTLPDRTRRSRVVGRLLECVDDGHVAMSHEQLRALCRLGPLPLEQGSRIAEHVAEQSLPPLNVSNSSVERLGVALRRQDIGKKQLAPLVDLADEWLGIERHMHSRGAALLRPLLSRTDLDDAQAGRVTARALEWLGVRGDTPFAGVILGLLLRRREVTVHTGTEVGDAPDLVGTAFTWLDTHSSHAYAAHVLSALLERHAARLTRTQEEDCVRMAADWLETTERPDAPDALRLAEQLGRR